jgi:predicted nucleotidyltransferase
MNITHTFIRFRGRKMVNHTMIVQIERDFRFVIEDRSILGVLLFGSHASGDATPRSDIDICIVVPDRYLCEMYSYIIINLENNIGKYDIRFFEELPLYIKMEVIMKGIPVISRDIPALYVLVGTDDLIDGNGGGALNVGRGTRTLRAFKSVAGDSVGLPGESGADVRHQNCSAMLRSTSSGWPVCCPSKSGSCDHGYSSSVSIINNESEKCNPSNYTLQRSRL